jgi:hypothetical protein
MKKLIFMILATVLFSVAISSCTEEAIQPTKDNSSCGNYPCPPHGGNGGGNTSDFPPK